MLLYPLGQSTVRTRRFRTKLGRLTIGVAFILVGAIYLAGVMIRIQTAIRG